MSDYVRFWLAKEAVEVGLFLAVLLCIAASAAFVMLVQAVKARISKVLSAKAGER